MRRSRSQRLSRDEWTKRVATTCQAARDAARDLSESFEALKNAEHAYRNGAPVVPAVLGSTRKVVRLVQEHEKAVKDKVHNARAWMKAAMATARQTVGQLAQLVEELQGIASTIYRRYQGRAEQFPATFRHERIATITRSMLDEEGDLFTRWLMEAETCWREVGETLRRIEEQSSSLARSLGERPGDPGGVAETVREGLAQIPRAGTTRRVPNVDPWMAGIWYQWMSPGLGLRPAVDGSRQPPIHQGSWWHTPHDSPVEADGNPPETKGADDEAS